MNTPIPIQVVVERPHHLQQQPQQKPQQQPQQQLQISKNIINKIKNIYIHGHTNPNSRGCR